MSRTRAGSASRPRDAVLYLRVAPSLKAELEAEAEDRGLSTNVYVGMVIKHRPNIQVVVTTRVVPGDDVQP